MFYVILSVQRTYHMKADSIGVSLITVRPKLTELAARKEQENLFTLRSHDDSYVLPLLFCDQKLCLRA